MSRLKVSVEECLVGQPLDLVFRENLLRSGRRNSVIAIGEASHENIL